MKRNRLFLLSLCMAASALFHPVYAEDINADEASEDTLAQQLGFETETADDNTFTQDIGSTILLDDLIVSLYRVETSENSRLYLEEICSRIESSITPDALNSETNARIKEFLESVSPLRIPEAVKNKLAMTYRYNQAEALRNCVDDPVSLLTYRHSFELSDLLVNGLYMPADASKSYMLYQNQLDPYFLQSIPALSEEQKASLSSALDALIQTLQTLSAAEPYALSAQEAETFAKQTESLSADESVRFLTENEETYSEYPGYWAALAESSFESGQYEQCLSAIDTYLEKQPPVYMKDKVTAQLMPYAVVSLQETVSIGATRVRRIESCLEHLIRNTDEDDWALRYFAAEAYLEISRTVDNPYQKTKYLNNAYTVIRAVVTHLADEQRNSNHAYMAEAVSLKAPEGASKEEKREIADLNRLLKEDRKTALPPLSQALMFSYDFLSALEDRAENVEEPAGKILNPDNETLFLNAYVDRLYRENGTEVPVPEITFDKKKLTVPVSVLAYDYTIRAVAEQGSDTYTLDDWKISEIRRPDADDLNSFTVELTSEKHSHMKYTEDMKVTVEIIPTELAPCEPVRSEYRTVIRKVFFFFNTVGFEKVS